jgi:protein-tyrosine kinase
VFSQLGEKTLLIDADMRNPRQHQLFSLPNQYGLSAFLTGRTNGSAIERVRHFENLSVLPAGATPPNPLELVSRHEFAALLTNEVGNYDVVIVDTPAAEKSSDAEAIAARSAGALLLARAHRSKNETLVHLATALQGARVELVGAVLSRHLS